MYFQYTTYLPSLLIKYFSSMKYLYRLLLATCISVTCSDVYAQSFHERYYRDGMYFFNDFQKIRLADLFTLHKEEFGLSGDDMLVPANNVVTEEGKFTIKYELRHKDIPVEGSMMNVIGDKGIAQYASGFLRTGLDVDKDHIITKDAAIDVAIHYGGARKYIWEDSTLEATLRAEEGPDATYYPRYASLVITKKRGEEYDHTVDNYKLCYKVSLNAVDPSGITDVFVDANTGVVFTTQNNVDEDYHESGTLWTWYNGHQSNLRARSCGACFNFWLHDVDRNIFTTTHGKSYFKKGFYNMDGNNNWVEEHIKTAASAEWALQRTWDYYFSRHGRWGTNYGGKRVHIQTALNGATAPNAYYSNTDVYGNDNGQDNIYITADGLSGATSGTPGYSMASLDVLAHEYTHGMIKASSALGSLGDFDAKALNEAYADMFGMKIEGQVMGTLDWDMGGSLGFSRRYFYNPHVDYPYPAPSKYLESGYWSNWNYHANGGVMRKWFHLLANGGTFNGQTVTGLGIEKATDIAYVTFNWWFWSNMRYYEASSQTIAQVKTDYGNCSNEHKQIVRSLRAVGFSVPILYCDGVPWIKGAGVAKAIRFQTIKWTAEIDSPGMEGGRFVWEVPKGWIYSTTGNTLEVTEFGDFESKEIAVTYTRDDKSYGRATKIVHFSDEDWTPTGSDLMKTADNTFSGLSPETSVRVGLFPNPAEQYFTIDLKGMAIPATVEIFDMNGRQIQKLQMNGNTQKIETGKMPNGIYFVKVSTQEAVFTQKLTVLH
jgi:Zn-dependent metalloprotease